MLEILALLAAQYESTEHSIRDASPAEMLAFLLDAGASARPRWLAKREFPLGDYRYPGGPARRQHGERRQTRQVLPFVPAVFIAEPASQPPFLLGRELAPDARQANP